MLAVFEQAKSSGTSASALAVYPRTQPEKVEVVLR